MAELIDIYTYFIHVHTQLRRFRDVQYNIMYIVIARRITLYQRHTYIGTYKRVTRILYIYIGLCVYRHMQRILI